LFTIAVEAHFRASHQITLPDDSKEPLHKHNWITTVEVSSEKLNEMGLVMDFERLRKRIEKIVAPFENTALETHDYFRKINSSAENVAKYIYERLEPMIPAGVKLESVRVIEKEGCSAKYRK
jgi:6-pyruvoyltetrahydropterin/6-carboxytetrahydropterin synthase